jgi:pimeloyl-ACP methyl ester carboxylesterase
MPYLNLPPDLRLHYRIDDHTDAWTDPETVLFIHGANESLDAYRAWVPHLSRRYRLIRFDLRGFGKSGPVPADFKYTTELFVDDMVRLINHLSREPVHVVTAKSGGITAVRLAAERPDLVRSLTLACCSPFPPKEDGWVEHMERPGGMRSWVRSTMRKRLGSRMPERGIDAWVDLMGATALSTMKAYFNWVTQTDMLPDLPRIQCPVLFITTESPNRTQKEMDVYKAQVNKLETAAVKSDGYHASGSDPDATAQLALDFIERHGRRQQPGGSHEK